MTEKSKRVVLVAHPDDEVLWAGGIVIRHPGDWTIICASVPRSDPIRAVKFKDACYVLNAEPMLIDWQEPPANEPFLHLDCIDLSPYDHILTHNAFGEYGHIQHKSIHNFVKRKYGKKQISTFGYRAGSKGIHRIDLTEFEEARKLKALKKYDHPSQYEGRTLPKWEALLDRYINKEGIHFGTETYDGQKF